MGYELHDRQVLRDPRGNQIGTVDYDGKVRDGWRDRGQVDNSGRYTDEYGLDQGYVNNTSSGDGGAGLILLFVFLIFYILYMIIVWIINLVNSHGSSQGSKVPPKIAQKYQHYQARTAYQYNRLRRPTTYPTGPSTPGRRTVPPTASSSYQMGSTPRPKPCARKSGPTPPHKR